MLVLNSWPSNAYIYSCNNYYNSHKIVVFTYQIVNSKFLRNNTARSCICISMNLIKSPRLKLNMIRGTMALKFKRSRAQ